MIGEENCLKMSKELWRRLNKIFHWVQVSVTLSGLEDWIQPELESLQSLDVARLPKKRFKMILHDLSMVHATSNRQGRGLRVLVGIAFAASWRHWRTLKNTEGLWWFVDLCLKFKHPVYSTLFYLFYGACQTKETKHQNERTEKIRGVQIERNGLRNWL